MRNRKRSADRVQSTSGVAERDESRNMPTEFVEPTTSYRDGVLGLTHLDLPRGFPQPDLTGQFSD